MRQCEMIWPIIWGGSVPWRDHVMGHTPVESMQRGLIHRYGDIVLYLAISLKIGLLAHHRGDFAELALDS